jgi:hypothetical protein
MNQAEMTYNTIKTEAFSPVKISVCVKNRVPSAQRPKAFSHKKDTREEIGREADFAILDDDARYNCSIYGTEICL